MRADRLFSCADNVEMQLLALPFIKDHLEMVFILPRKRFGLAKLEKSLTGGKLWRWINSSQKSNLDVIYCRFFPIWDV